MSRNHHDLLLRAIFGQPQHAAAELRAVLPAELLEKLDLDRLMPIEASFIDAELRSSCADLLFTAPYRSGGEALLYLLIEHQSTLDPWMPLRLLRYMTRIWERHAAERRAGAAARAPARLPPIVPLLLHQGPSPWPWPTSFRAAVLDLAGLGEPISLRLLDFEFLLDDLATASDAKLLERTMDAVARLTLVALRNARATAELATRVAAAMEALRDDLRGASTIPALAQLVRYVLEVGEAPPAETRARLSAALAPHHRSSVMSTADMLRAEGRIEGRVEAQRESLRVILEARFGPISATMSQRIESATSEQLIAWIRRAAVVASSDALGAE